MKILLGNTKPVLIKIKCGRKDWIPDLVIFGWKRLEVEQSVEITPKRKHNNYLNFMGSLYRLSE